MYKRNVFYEDKLKTRINEAIESDRSILETIMMTNLQEISSVQESNKWLDQIDFMFGSYLSHLEKLMLSLVLHKAKITSRISKRKKEGKTLSSDDLKKVVDVLNIKEAIRRLDLTDYKFDEWHQGRYALDDGLMAKYTYDKVKFISRKFSIGSKSNIDDIESNFKEIEKRVMISIEEYKNYHQTVFSNITGINVPEIIRVIRAEHYFDASNLIVNSHITKMVKNMDLIVTPDLHRLLGQISEIGITRYSIMYAKHILGKYQEGSLNYERERRHIIELTMHLLPMLFDMCIKSIQFVPNDDLERELVALIDSKKMGKLIKYDDVELDGDLINYYSETSQLESSFFIDVDSTGNYGWKNAEDCLKSYINHNRSLYSSLDNIESLINERSIKEYFNNREKLNMQIRTTNNIEVYDIISDFMDNVDFNRYDDPETRDNEMEKYERNVLKRFNNFISENELILSTYLNHNAGKVYKFEDECTLLLKYLFKIDENIKTRCKIKRLTDADSIKKVSDYYDALLESVNCVVEDVLENEMMKIRSLLYEVIEFVFGYHSVREFLILCNDRNKSIHLFEVISCMMRLPTRELRMALLVFIKNMDNKDLMLLFKAANVCSLSSLNHLEPYLHISNAK